MAAVDAGAAARWIARAMGVPADIVKPPAPAPDPAALAALAGAAPPQIPVPTAA
jgi:hypothetical protein